MEQKKRRIRRTALGLHVELDISVVSEGMKKTHQFLSQVYHAEAVEKLKDESSECPAVVMGGYAVVREAACNVCHQVLQEKESLLARNLFASPILGSLYGRIQGEGMRMEALGEKKATLQAGLRGASESCDFQGEEEEEKERERSRR